jgi:hypothetical protein
MRSIITLLAMIGVILIAVGFIQNSMQCPPGLVEYRYIPKTFDQEQQVHTPLLSMSGIYQTFEDDDPWFLQKSWATQDVKNANSV